MKKSIHLANQKLTYKMNQLIKRCLQHSNYRMPDKRYSFRCEKIGTIKIKLIAADFGRIVGYWYIMKHQNNFIIDNGHTDRELNIFAKKYFLQFDKAAKRVRAKLNGKK